MFIISSKRKFRLERKFIVFLYLSNYGTLLIRYLEAHLLVLRRHCQFLRVVCSVIAKVVLCHTMDCEQCTRSPVRMGAVRQWMLVWINELNKIVNQHCFMCK